MSVSGEGAALRSARTWLLLLCPEIPDRRGGKRAESVAVSRKAAAQGAWAGRKGAMAWRMALLGSNMAPLGHTRGETHKGGSKGPFLTRIGASSERLRARLALHAPTPAFERRRSRPLTDRGLRPPSAVDRGSRPSTAAADRGIEIGVATADPCRVGVIIMRTRGSLICAPGSTRTVLIRIWHTFP